MRTGPSAAWLGLALWSAAIWPQPAGAQLFKRTAPQPAEIEALGLEQHALDRAGRQRVFLVQAPPGPAAPMAIVVLLHGGRGSMRKAIGPQAGASRGWLDVARANNALLLIPNGTNPETGDAAGDHQFWNDLRTGPGVRTTTVDDVGFILAVIEWAKARDRATANVPVFITGASNGGMMTYRLLIEAPERFAAAAAFISALPADLDRLQRPARPTPLLIMNGTADRLVKWEGGEIIGKRGPVVSAAANLAWWLQSNRAAAAPAETRLLADVDPNDGCRIKLDVHPAREGGAPVHAYTMQGGGHAMPSRRHPIADNFIVRRFIGNVCRDVEAASLAWAFFVGHAQPR